MKECPFKVGDRVVCKLYNVKMPSGETDLHISTVLDISHYSEDFPLIELDWGTRRVPENNSFVAVSLLELAPPENELEPVWGNSFYYRKRVVA